MTTYINDEIIPVEIPDRGVNYLKAGDKVVCFVGDCDSILPEKAFSFVTGKIVGRRQDDTDSIIVNTDECIYKDGKMFIDCRIRRPYIMRYEEFEFFQRFPDKFRIWVSHTPIENGRTVNLAIIEEMIKKLN